MRGSRTLKFSQAPPTFCLGRLEFKNHSSRVPIVAQQKQIQLGSMRTWVRTLASLSGLRIWRCQDCGVGYRHASDPALLWLWCRPAAVAPTQPLGFELPYPPGAAMKKKKKMGATHVTLSVLLAVFLKSKNKQVKLFLKIE